MKEEEKVDEEDPGVIGKATGFIGDQYSAVCDLGNAGVEYLDNFARNSETI